MLVDDNDDNDKMLCVFFIPKRIQQLHQKSMCRVCESIASLTVVVVVVVDNIVHVVDNNVDDNNDGCVCGVVATSS